MMTQVTATVIGGMLKPDQSLALPDETRVNLTIEPITEKREPAAAWEALKARLRQRPIDGPATHFTRDELHERH